MANVLSQADKYTALLKELHACEDARREANGKSLAEVWTTCERSDWLLWLCGKMVGRDGWPTRQQVVLAACACAETALKYVPKGEERPAKAITTARAWANGTAALDEVRTAANAAYAAYTDAADTYAADAYAAARATDAYAAARAARAARAANAVYAAAAAADFDADAAARAAFVAAAAAYAADADAACKSKLKELAELVRSMLTVPKELPNG